MLGYACSNITLMEKEGITPAKSCKLSTLLKSDNPIGHCVELAKKNLLDTYKILEWNIENNIKMYRMSASMFPFATHKDWSWGLDYLEKEIEKLSEIINKYDLRVSSHLPQFINLGSPSTEVVEKSIIDVMYYVEFLDRLGVDDASKIIIHAGGVYGDREATSKRFIDVYNSLPDNAKNRLVIENDEKSWSVEQLMKLREQTGMTVLVDYLHWQLNHEEGISWDEDLEKALSTWNCRPKIHYSEQDPEKNRGAHSFYVENVIQSDRFDTMVEAKGKELAIMKFM